MGIKRSVVLAGKRVAGFFANDLQNLWYRYSWVNLFKEHIAGKTYEMEPQYKADALKYWKERTGLSVNPCWHGFYASRNGVKDVRYVPENVYYAYIEPFYNRKDLCASCDDKNYYSERFPDSAVPGGVKRPKILLRNVSGNFFDTEYRMLTFDKAAQMLHERDEGYVIKESITGRGGNRIIFVEKGEHKTKEELLEIFHRYGRDFVVESLISQCAELAALNPSSVNTVRFITFLNIARGEVDLLSACMRMGGGTSRTDNFSTGGVACGIDENGVLKEYGYDQHFNQYRKQHPNGQIFAGVQIPNYQTAVNFVKTLHPRFGHYRIISWDIAISEDYKPTIIEFNLTPQSVDMHQINNGPLFGNLTEQVLEEVFHGRHR